MQGKFREFFLAVVLLIALSGIADAENISGYDNAGVGGIYGGLMTENAYSIHPTADGGNIIAGSSNSADGNVTGNHGLNDVWVVKTTAGGVLDWQRSYGGSQEDYAYSVDETADGGYIVAGSTASNDGDVSGNHGPRDIWILKVGPLGTPEWQRCLGGTNDEEAYSIQQTSDGGYIVAGYTTSTNGDVFGNHGNCDFWVVKLDSNGYIVWQKCLGGTGYEMARSVQQTTDGGYIVAGYTDSTDGNVEGSLGQTDFWVAKLDSAGRLMWQKCLGGTHDDIAYSIQQTADGGYIAAGETASTDIMVQDNHGGHDVWVVRLNKDGLPLWYKCFGGTGTDLARSVLQAADGGFIVAGETDSHDGDVTGVYGFSLDTWVVKLGDQGTLLWQKCFGGSMADGARSVRQTSDGGYIVAGTTSSNDGMIWRSYGMSDFWVVKIQPEYYAEFFANPLEVHVNQPVSFSETSLASIRAWNWSFGDGTLSSEIAPVHSYDTPGNYTISLNCTRTNFQTLFTQKENYIHVTDSPGIDLISGWNFISVNRTLDPDHAGAFIFENVNTSGHTIWQYEASDRTWRPMLVASPVRPLDAIWIYSASPCHVPLEYNTEWNTAPPMKTLYKGWNAIGYAGTDPLPSRLSLLSLGDKWTSVIGFDAVTQQYTTPIIRGGAGTVSDDRTLVPKQAYWIYMTTNETLAMNV